MAVRRLEATNRPVESESLKLKMKNEKLKIILEVGWRKEELGSCVLRAVFKV